MYLPVRVACLRCEDTVRGFHDSRGVSFQDMKYRSFNDLYFFYTVIIPVRKQNNVERWTNRSSCKTILETHFT